MLAEQPAQPRQQGNAPGRHAGGLPPAVEKLFEFFLIQPHPFAAETDEPVLPGQQFLQLGFGEGIVTQYHARVEAQQGRDIECGGAVGLLVLAAGLQLHLQLHAGRAALPQVHHAGFDARLFQQGLALQKIVGLTRPPGTGLVDFSAVDELVQERMLRRRLLQRAQKRCQRRGITGIHLAGHGQRCMARPAVLPGAVNKGRQKGKRMRFCPLTAIFSQVKTQLTQLLPALAQRFKPFLRCGQLAFCLPV